MFDKLEKVKERFKEITELLNKPETIADQNEFRKLSREYAELTDIVKAYDEYNKIKGELEANRKLQDDNTDADMKELALAEEADLIPKFEKIEADLKDLLVPKDPNDSKNAILEIRAGTGGEEAALFA